MRQNRRVAVIDVGSNSIRLAVADVAHRSIHIIYSDRAVTRLGRGVQENRVLDKESIEKSLYFIEKFKIAAKDLSVDTIIAVGTSALRDAEDGLVFRDLVKERTGIELKILTGDEEAFFTIEGIKAGIDDTTPPLYAFDIGGGSIEWIYEGKSPIRGSINFGVVKAFGRFFKPESDIKRAAQNLREFFNDLIRASLPKENACHLIATGGTAVTVAMIEKRLSEYAPSLIHRTIVKTEKIRDMINKIVITNFCTWEYSSYVPRDRLELLLPGLIILDSIASFLDIELLLISDYGLIEGLMINHERFCYNSLL